MRSCRPRTLSEATTTALRDQEDDGSSTSVDRAPHHLDRAMEP